jgi:hypothetical protein
LDKVGGGSIGPTLGQGGGQEQCSDPRNQEEIEDHINPRTSQRDARDKKYAGTTYHCANTKIGA